MINYYNPIALMERFATIGATFVRYDNLTVTEPTTGLVVGNGRSSFTVSLDRALRDNLARAFTRVVALLDTAVIRDNLIADGQLLSDDEPDFLLHSVPSYGLWLDFESTPPTFLFESGRVFDQNDIARAIDYAVKHQQRWIYDIGNARAFEIAKSRLDESNERHYLDDELAYSIGIPDWIADRIEGRSLDPSQSVVKI